jgi:hypothetical protein
MSNDWMSYIVVAIFAFTNGYVSCIAMMYAPQLAATADEGQVHFIFIFCIPSVACHHCMVVTNRSWDH